MVLTQRKRVLRRETPLHSLFKHTLSEVGVATGEQQLSSHMSFSFSYRVQAGANYGGTELGSP